MNIKRVVLGGLLGGVVANLVSMIIGLALLMPRYELLQKSGIFRAEPRLPFAPLWILLLLVIPIGLVWLYAAARPRLGPGPVTALRIGLTVGLIAGLPYNMAAYAWSYEGGFVALWHAIDTMAGYTLATLVGAWFYRE